MTDQDQPRGKARKLSVRITAGGHDRITARAARADVTASHMVRRMLAFADENMPEGYIPNRRRQPTTSTNPRSQTRARPTP